ncbi:hypothetical protein CGRA01v4_05909 [Colletotrichum graminicola]|nr:hypothetical protein CGRA01v4_05909 [Colletotrichum graminicola]
MPDHSFGFTKFLDLATSSSRFNRLNSSQVAFRASRPPASHPGDGVNGLDSSSHPSADG